MSSGLRALYRSRLRGLPISPGLTMFNSPVHPLSRSLSRDSMRGNRYPRLCPQSQSSHSRNGNSVISQLYDLMSSKPSDTRSVPMLVRDAAVLERTLRSALESYNFQLRTMMALFCFSGDSGQIPLELWPSWRQEEENLSSVTWCLPSRRLRSAIWCQILSFSRRIYLRLPLLTQLDMPQGMCPYTKEHSLGLPRHLRRLRGGPSLRLRHPRDTLNLCLLLLRHSAPKPPLLRNILRPRRGRPIPRGGFRG